MKDNQFSISSKSNYFSKNIISRCPNSNCIFIPHIYLFNKEGIDYIHYKCKNGHEDDISLENYLIKSKNKQLDSVLCDYHNNHKNINAQLYCFKCKKFICKDCKLKHDIENKEYSLIKLKNIDKYCPKHNDMFNIYCEDCEKSFCIYCPDHPKNHNVELIQRMKFEEIEIKNLENQIINSKIFMTKIKELYENIIEEIKNSYQNFKEMNELEIKLIEDLIITYKNSESHQKLNAEIIMKIKNNIILNEMKDEINMKERINKKIEYIMEIKNKRILNENKNNGKKEEINRKKVNRYNNNNK